MTTAQAFREAADHANNSAHWTPIEWHRLDVAAVVRSLERYADLLLAAAEQREQLDGFLHEQKMIKADLAQFVTDCSTPTFQLVRNACEAHDRVMTKAAERLGQQEAAIDQLEAEVTSLRTRIQTLTTQQESLLAEHQQRIYHRDQQIATLTAELIDARHRIMELTQQLDIVMGLEGR